MKRILLAFAFIPAFLGCERTTYDDGPFISPLTKTKRLCREWQLEEINGAPYPTNTTWEFEEDGDLDEITTVNGVNTAKTWYWYWNSDQTGIDVSFMGGNTEIDISRLTRNEFHFDINGDEYRCTANN
jgi:hypothetical protein